MSITWNYITLHHFTYYIALHNLTLHHVTSLDQDQIIMSHIFQCSLRSPSHQGWPFDLGPAVGSEIETWSVRPWVRPNSCKFNSITFVECEMYFRVPITQKTNHLYIAITILETLCWLLIHPFTWHYEILAKKFLSQIWAMQRSNGAGVEGGNSGRVVNLSVSSMVGSHRIWSHGREVPCPQIQKAARNLEISISRKISKCVKSCQDYVVLSVHAGVSKRSPPLRANISLYPHFFKLRKQEQLQLVFCHCRCLLCPLVLDNGARCSFAAAAQTIATMQIPPLLAPPDGFQGAVFAGAAKANLKPSKLLVSGMPGATVMAQLTVINELYPL